MSETKAGRKAAPPPDGGEAELPGWLQHSAFSDLDRRLYLEAAERASVSVTDWARQILNRAARAMLGTSRRERRRAPSGLRLVLRRGGHARRPLGHA